ncbi:hypothetical protein ABZ599_37160 [Streptomyces misionensis]|uniref:hypothetical protein n=1 Tax=Streptomyces misionensis TaxID=67331 RepID=UPI003406C991
MSSSRKTSAEGVGTVNVRITDTEITATRADGPVFTGLYRLVTTLTDARRHPARALINLYHARWEYESTYFALPHDSGLPEPPARATPPASNSRMWALLTLYRALRAVMAEAAESVPRHRTRPVLLHRRPAYRP